jgi:hypothetical protein
MLSLNLAHVHLLLNHFPTIGFGIGVCLFLVGLVGKNEELKRASLVILFLIAVLAIPTYLTGAAALGKLCSRSSSGSVTCPDGLSVALIQEHEDWALLAFSVMEVTGLFAWIGLWQLRRTSKLAQWNVTAVLLLSLIAFGLVSVAANKGGDIRHPEIQTAQDVATASAGERTPIARAIGSFVIGKTWVWPTCETLHFVGLCLLFVTVLFVNLRLLGVAKSLPFAALYQLMPLGIVGFGINLVTGMMFFLAAPQQYINNVEFHRKMIFVVLAGINVLYFMLFDKAWKVEAGDDAPLSSKIAAASAIFLWVGILYYGEMLPFLGNAF